MTDSSLTCPEVRAHYVGTPSGCFICFAYCVLADGRVVVHSTLCDIDDDNFMDFLYEVSERGDALEAATSMVEDAVDYLRELGERVDENVSSQDFLDKLRQQLACGLH